MTKTGRPPKYPGEKMVHRSIRYPNSLWKAIEEMAQERGVSVSEFMVKMGMVEVERHTMEGKP